MDSNKMVGEEAITQECCEQSWTSPAGNTPQDTNCTATCLLSRKLFKLDEPDMQDTAGEVLLWTPTHGRAKAGRPARKYIQQLCEDTGCCPEYLPRAMNDREKWRERFRDIRATSTTWWWWWWWVLIPIIQIIEWIKPIVWNRYIWNHKYVWK